MVETFLKLSHSLNKTLKLKLKRNKNTNLGNRVNLGKPPYLRYFEVLIIIKIFVHVANKSDKNYVQITKFKV